MNGLTEVQQIESQKIKATAIVTVTHIYYI